MNLDNRQSFPATRRYVLKLHREALPQHGRVLGRLENLNSGDLFDFTSGDQLLVCLALDALTDIDVDQLQAPASTL
jgi:hypothetical protein